MQLLNPLMRNTSVNYFVAVHPMFFSNLATRDSSAWRTLILPRTTRSVSQLVYSYLSIR